MIWDIINVVLMVLYALSCILIIFLVLIQVGKGSTAGIFGGMGGASQSAFGAQSGNVLTKVTTGLGIFFIVGALLLAKLNSTSKLPKRVVTMQKTSTEGEGEGATQGESPAQVSSDVKKAIHGFLTQALRGMTNKKAYLSLLSPSVAKAITKKGLFRKKASLIKKYSKMSISTNAVDFNVAFDTLTGSYIASYKIGGIKYTSTLKVISNKLVFSSTNDILSILK